MAYCGGIFAASSLSVLPFLNLPDELVGRWASVPFFMSWTLFSLFIASGTSWVVVFSQKFESRLKPLLLVPIGLLVVAFIRTLGLQSLARLQVYGDAGRLQGYLSDPNLEFGRWLLGLTMLRELFIGVNSFVVEVDPKEFVQVAGALCMCAWSMWLLMRHESSVIPWIISISPMWILFSLGYDEYYPFITGLLLLAAWQVVSRETLFRLNSAYIIIGVLPVMYIGAMPISLALLLHTWSRQHNVSDRFRGLVLSIISTVIAIEVGGEFLGYATSLSETMNLGGTFLESSPGSKAAAASSKSFFAHPSYALSLEHLIDIWFWLSCGIGLIVIVAALTFRSETVQRDNSWRSEGRPQLGLSQLSILALVGLAIFYLVFMLPLLGPTRDIDLYFASMFVLLLFAGSRFDRYAEKLENPSLERLRFMQLAAFGFAPATMALVVFGVSR
ncbi:MAG: hypothetical protein ACO31D_04060 [Ilumatobacteraceae bacterium]